ncbi:hypothetical protein F5Y12DRAFT_720366 [Xylaria sp. FL1777]|nr:hypothetical protein F5Y12DRAFT_720366 [Xylaria sp. FL1777]
MSLLRLPAETLTQIFDQISANSGSNSPFLHFLERPCGDLKLRRFPACIFTYYPQEDAQESDALKATASNEAPEDIPVKIRIKVLNNDLGQLAILR